MNILSCNYNHDGSAAILKNGKIAGYVNTERFTRVKKQPGVTKEVLDELFKIADVSPSNIDLYLLNNLNYMFAPKYYSDHNGYYQNSWENFLIEDLVSDPAGTSLWPPEKQKRQSNKIFIDIKDYGLDKNNRDFFPRISNLKINFNTHAFFRGFRRPCIVNMPHYLLHASTVYYSSPFKSSAIFVWDPTGFEAFVAKGNEIYPIFNNQSLNMVNLGSIYADVSEQILNEDSLTAAGKMMGLAPYGKFELEQKMLDYDLFLNKDSKKIFDILNQSPKNGQVTYKEKNKILDAGKAFLVQSLFENQLTYIFKLIYQYCIKNDIELNICLSGGSTLNCVANEKAFSSSKFKNIFMHPACGDDGTSIGAALYYWHCVLKKEKYDYSNSELMYSKKEYTNLDIKNAIQKFVEKINVIDNSDYINLTAEYLADGKIVAWYEGGSEIGPRALGHRSILADPRSSTIRDILNSVVKGRESYRPLAPSVLEEYSEEWFGIKESPFMLRASKILKENIPGISHVDKTSRPQTVSKIDNKNYYNLIESFYKKTGVPLVLDTSFNIKGEPIVESPLDALKSFLNSKIDVLVFPNIIITKK